MELLLQNNIFRNCIIRFQITFTNANNPYFSEYNVIKSLLYIQIKI